MYKPREYQQQILSQVKHHYQSHIQSIIELDCGAGKRFLQHQLISDVFSSKRILLLLQATTSLYETQRYFTEIYKTGDVSIIDSRRSSQERLYTLQNARVVLALPQTLFNTLKKFSIAIEGFEICIINEVDQLIKRTAQRATLRQPYPQLMPFLTPMHIIGMSGTLRDDHYVRDGPQQQLLKELETLQFFIKRSEVITMDTLMQTDINEYLSTTKLILTGIKDKSIINLSNELQAHITENQNAIIVAVREIDPDLADHLQEKPTRIFNADLPIEDATVQKFFRGYLVRKYLWGLPGKSGRKHLYSYGLDSTWVQRTSSEIPGKFYLTEALALQHKKSVILCSYLDTCDLLQKMFQTRGIATVLITGKVPQRQRDAELSHFRETDDQIVAILSNVGERDLDIPEAELLIVFDLVRTTKTVYQKLKRTRGGICRILHYMDTDETKKASDVISKMLEKYPWSTELLPAETYAPK